MIYINIDKVRPYLSDEWIEKTRRLTEELSSLSTDKERRNFIARHEDVWREVKDAFLRVSHGKCWYSEAREICSDYHVDHFRPKNRAVELDGRVRQGYWWLAFNWTNYRIAGSICNSSHADSGGTVRGKRDFFPLKEGSAVASDRNHDLRDEIIYFLDPADPNDPMLLTFDETGLPQPVADEGSWQFDRASVTAKLLFLDYPPMVEERRRVWLECRMVVGEVQRLIGLGSSAMSASRVHDLRVAMERLRRLVRSDAELAGTARACLLKSGLSWAARIAIEGEGAQV